MSTILVAPVKFNTFEDVKSAIASRFNDGKTFEDLKALQQAMKAEKQTILAMLSGLTKTELVQYSQRDMSEKKDKLISSAYTNLLTRTSLERCVSYSPMQETYEQGLERCFLAETRERFEECRVEHFKEIQEYRDRKAAFYKAMNNPETLEEFKTFLRHNPIDKLTAEQRLKYDELNADSIMERKAQQVNKPEIVKQVEGVNTGMTIIENLHAKKQCKIWVVKLETRVSDSVYNELLSRAKQLGGYYSRYSQQGAIPGFIFSTPEAAQKFTEVSEGDVDKSDLNATAGEIRTQTTAESLYEKGAALENAGQTKLNQDRKSNTARRARMAANAEADAEWSIKLGQILQTIAERMSAGTIKYLGGIRTKADLNTLLGVMTSAKHRHIRDKNLKWDNYEYSDETLNYVEVPFIKLYKDSDTRRLQSIMNAKTKGKQLAAARLLKVCEAMKEESQPIGCYTAGQNRLIMDYKLVFLTPCKGIDKWEIDNYAERFMAFTRAKNMGLETGSMIRMAIRELMEIRSNAGVSEEQKRMLQIRELERSFVGKKIEGFFPTPPALVQSILNKATIEEGHTILEPSAGLGHIADAIVDRFDNELTTIEQYHPLVEALKLKGYEPLHMDFLDHKGEYDRIIMNPPFENYADIKHVMHAFTLLKPGGRLVAIMAGNKNNQAQICTDFRDFVDQHGYMEQNPEQSFVSAFRPTGVNTVTVVLDK